MIYCKYCKTEKPETEFYTNRTRCCKPCHLVKVRRYYHRSARKFRYRGILLSNEEYDRRLQLQNYVCAICHKTENPNGKVKRLAVDHDHKTGFVRGLICRRCNMLLGQAKDDIELLTKASEYIKSNTIRQAQALIDFQGKT